MQQLQTGSKEIDKTIELTSKIRHKLKECVDDICSSFSEVNILQRSLLEPIETLQTHTQNLCKNVNRIDLGSVEVGKVAQEFFEKGSATEKRAYELVKNISSYMVIHDDDSEVSDITDEPVEEEVNESETTEAEDSGSL